jgi:glycosyltransferase involved in cell wall biosynthesis
VLQFISILLPVYNEEKFIQNCIESVLTCDYPEANYEIIVIDGNSTDKTLELLKAYPQVRVLHNPQKIVPISMNMGILEARGSYIVRLDAHSSYPKEYFSKLIAAAEELHADNVGAVCLTDVKKKNSISLAIKESLSHRFGVGDSMFRTGVNKITEVDTVPFGCFRRDVFTRFGNYDERLVRNQDIELNKRIKRGGGKVYLIPDIYCTYFARDTFSGFIKSNYSNGLWNILTIYHTKTLDSLSIRHFIPLFFVLSIIVPPILIFLYPPLIYLSVLSLCAYLFLILLISTSLLNKKKVKLFPIIIVFLGLHLSYGWGSLVGILKVLRLKIKGK